MTIKCVMINELDVVVLNEDFPENELKTGDVGTVVHIHQGGKAFIVEFIDYDGDTIGLITVEPDQVSLKKSS